MSSDESVSRVVIIGGTHGNETVGPTLIERWQRAPAAVSRASFQTRLLIGNPLAVSRRLRYIDRDLNRCFAAEEAEDEESCYESERARHILSEIGPTGSTPADLILDLHTTTSNMKRSLILVNREPYNLELAAAVQSQDPKVRTFLWLDESLPRRSLSSVARRGVTIEVGPVPNNVLRADQLLATEEVVLRCLDFCEARNQRGGPQAGSELTCFTYVDRVDYPRDSEGRPTAVVHPELQDRDYEALEPGQPMFLGLDGRTLTFEGPEPLFPVFINEAAYYEKNIAFCLTRRETLRV